MTDDDTTAPRVDGEADRGDAGGPDTSGAPGEPTAAETACFEAGVKFGSLYHQFAGTPVSPGSGPALAAAMEAAIENQPFCEAVTVDLDEAAIEAATGDYGYTELTGRFMTVTIDVDYEGVAVRARMAMEDGYPRMRLERVDRAGD